MQTSWEDKRLIEAVKGLAASYEKMDRVDDCVRLTVKQAQRIAELADHGYWSANA